MNTMYSPSLLNEYRSQGLWCQEKLKWRTGKLVLAESLSCARHSGVGGFGDVLGCHQVHQQRGRVVLTTPLPPSPPASSMIGLPKHLARNPASSGQQMGCGEQRWRGLHQAPPATDEGITFLFRNIRQDSCSPQRKAPALWGRRHQVP